MSTTGTRVDETILNVDELIERCMGHLDFLERILAKFQVHFEDDLGLLERSVEAGDAEQVVCVAHRLKGSAANVAAAGLRDRAAEIEQLGREGWRSEIPERVAEMRHDWTHFVDQVASLDLRQATR